MNITVTVVAWVRISAPLNGGKLLQVARCLSCSKLYKDSQDQLSLRRARVHEGRTEFTGPLWLEFGAP